MNIRNFILFSSVALMSVACQDNKEPDSPKPTPTPGKEIQFGGELDVEASSRTVYGDEVNYAFPISWVQNDQVLIYSPDVNSGREKANYKVTESGKAAGVFQKMGAAGIQWGTEASARFYSVYPGIYNGDKTIPVEHDTQTQKTTFTLNMTDFQTCKYGEGTSTAFHVDSVDRFGAIMYAKTATEVLNGQTVNLQYKPLATALRVKLNGPEQQNEVATISQIKLIAPVPIAGEFTAVFTDSDDDNAPIVAPTSNSKYEITLYAQHNDGEAFLTIPYGKSADLNFFIIPTTTTENTRVTITDDWKIEVILAGYPPLTKSLGGTETEGHNMKIIPGMVHRLPDLPRISLKGEWDIATWMRYIPRNVYLSEISIPGSWNSLNPDFQGTSPSIDFQYTNGCRAFHLDCRYKGTGSSESNVTDLAIANGGSTYTVSGEKIMQNDAPTFKESLKEIISNVKEDEYMVVLCTFAQNSHQKSGTTWYQDISDICNDSEITAFIKDGKKITPTTTVGEVLYNVIVIVNCEGDPQSMNLPASSKCLFVNAPLTLTRAMFPPAGSYNQSNLFYGTKGSSGINFINTQAQICTLSTPYTNGDRGFAPLVDGSYDDWWVIDALKSGSRIKNAQKVLDLSKSTFSTTPYNHNQWYYLGLGGYVQPALGDARSYDQVTYTLNRWINGRVLNMSSTPSGNQTIFFPVGIVLMNYAAYDTYSGFSSSYKDVLGRTTSINILKLNNRYHKAYDPKKPAFPTDDTTTKSKAPGYSSGMVDRNEDAISWATSSN
ncbi:MAG: hypothetical protein HUJ98_08085 [Bacteroidaceae bacterium]|nr:hypothetical protein [Bacteroidaceae bacterium]